MFILGLQNDNTQLTRRMVEDMGGMRESLSSVHNTIKKIESDLMGKHQPHLNLRNGLEIHWLYSGISKGSIEDFATVSEYET